MVFGVVLRLDDVTRERLIPTDRRTIFFRPSEATADVSCRTTIVFALFFFLLVACIFLLFPDSANAEPAYFRISTATGDTSQGYVGFTPDSLEAYAEADLRTGNYPTAYAIPKEGYEFAFWATRYETNQPVSLDPALPWLTWGGNYDTRDDGTICAFFRKTEPRQCIVSFDFGAQGDAVMPLALVDKGSKYVLPAFPFWQEHLDSEYYFAGWDLGAPGDVVNIDSDTVLVAQWKRIGWDYCSVTFDGTGGAGYMDCIWSNGEEEVTLPECSFAHPDKVFAGWDAGKPGDSLLISKDTIVTALWRDPEPGEAYRLTLLSEERQPPLLFQRDDETKNCSLLVCPGQYVSFNLEYQQDNTVELLTATGITLSNRPFAADEGQWTFLMPANDVTIMVGDVEIPDPSPAPGEHTHALTACEAVNPTCDAPGTEAYWKCTECGKLFSDADGTHEIAAPVEIPAGHDWGEWEVTKEPTTTEEGEKTRVCKRDSSHTETMAIAPKGETEEPYEIAMTEDLIWLFKVA